MPKVSESEKQSAKEMLLKYIKMGDTLYTVLHKVSSDGISRHISVVMMIGVKPVDISNRVSTLLGIRMSKLEHLIVGGCGMDVGFEVIYELSHALFKDNFICLGEGCPSNDHFNGDRDYKPHKHSDAGYALRHSWL